MCRYLERLSNLHYRALLQMLRDEARRHCPAGDALLYIVGRPHLVAAKIADNKYESTSLSSCIIAWRDNNG